MGVNLREIAEPRDMGMEQLCGKAVAVDALNTIFQFLSIIRDRMTGEPLKDSRGKVTSHLSGLFYRTTRMLESGIMPVFVFDGKAPAFKRKVQDGRHQARQEAREKWERAVKEGDREKIRLYSQQASEVTSDMLEESRRLLEAMGVQHVTAPSEGEAQAACMNRSGAVYACGSQDWDSLLFGASRLVRNLTVTGKRKLPNKETYVTVNPHVIELEPMLSRLGITHDQLILIGMLTGTDYNPGGVKGFGPKKALDFVKEHGKLESVLDNVSWDFETPASEIFAFFKEPPSEEVSIAKTSPDPELVKRILVDEHEFSMDRIGKTLEKLQGAGERKKQSSLDRFL